MRSYDDWKTTEDDREHEIYCASQQLDELENQITEIEEQIQYAQEDQDFVKALHLKAVLSDLQDEAAPIRRWLGR